MGQVKGGFVMSKEERKEMIERLAKKFTSLPESEKKFITGYMVGTQEVEKSFNTEIGKTEKRELARCL